MLKSLGTYVLTLNRVRKFARKSKEYKLTYAFILHLADEEELNITRKDEIEHITKLFKSHCSMLDADFDFIASS